MTKQRKRKKKSAVKQLGHNYWWLSRRVHELRLGMLNVEDEEDN
ncbi:MULTISPECIES: hypothetical protein [Lactiplantibacillus]|nr:hypothetical protein [Lactiplantibacillus plantarum]WIR73767.1 hypothetical protein QP382_06055 [Lactiplantibacillus plantarum]